MRERLLEPLGAVDGWVGMPRERWQEERDLVAPMFAVGDGPPRELPFDSDGNLPECESFLGLSEAVEATD